MESKRVAIEATQDRISKLPDSVLQHIFSLPCFHARDPVLLSVMSTRWRNFWKSMTFLNLVDGNFLACETDGSMAGDFARFVDALLLLRDRSDLHLFRLEWCIDLHPDGQHHLNSWLHHALTRNVKAVDLYFYAHEMHITLPSCIFTFQSVETLRIVFRKIVKISLPLHVGLRCLRKLHLCSVLLDGVSMDKLVFGCPVLEELTLDESLLVSVNIAFRALRGLIIERCFIVGKVFGISCPSLLSCHLVRNYFNVQQTSLENLSSVVSASVVTDADPDLRSCGNAAVFVRGKPSAETLKNISSSLEDALFAFVFQTSVLSQLPQRTDNGYSIEDYSLPELATRMTKALERAQDFMSILANTPENLAQDKFVDFFCGVGDTQVGALVAGCDAAGDGDADDEVKKCEPITDMYDQKDRISQLPDPILHHILSNRCLKMQYVVRTWILSKRWRNVWTSLPNLSFDDYNYYYHDENVEKTTDFPTFVNTVLLHRDASDVQSFHVNWSNGGIVRHGPQHVLTWMQYAISHNVKKLEIYLSEEKAFPDDQYEYPCCIFTCSSLEFLSIGGTYTHLPEVVSLSRLRNLHIDCIKSGPVLLKTLISGCPVLEDLHLKVCYLDDPNISSNSLKKLNIEQCWISGTRIRIAIHSLQSLELSGNDIQGVEILLENLLSLVEASFQTDDSEEYIYSDDEPDPDHLKFAGQRIEGMPSEKLSGLQTFNELKKLELHGWSMLKNFPTVVHFLHRSPNLKLLKLRNTLSTYEEQKPTLNKLFVCPHINICVLFNCGAENDSISELMTDFLNGKCGCYQE